MIYLSRSPRVAPRLRSFLLSAQLIWLAGCQHNDAFKDENVNAQIATDRGDGLTQKNEQFSLFRRRLRTIAGNAAVDCGFIRIWQKPDAASNCVLKVHAEGKPFYVAYVDVGIDSDIAQGFAGDARGNVFKLEYDSAGTSPDGLPKNVQLSDGNHITIEPCSKRGRLRTAKSGKVTCFLRDL
jgi:hypothetical protein